MILLACDAPTHGKQYYNIVKGKVITDNYADKIPAGSLENLVADMSKTIPFLTWVLYHLADDVLKMFSIIKESAKLKNRKSIVVVTEKLNPEMFRQITTDTIL